MTIDFGKYALTGSEFVKKVAIELGDKENTSRAGRILRAVLHVLRDQSTPQESMQFISQLPMFIKAIYVDGWRLGSDKGRVWHLDDFITAVRNEAASDDFLNEESCSQAIQAVFRVIREYVSDGEIEDLRRTLPEEIRVLLGD